MIHIYTYTATKHHTHGRMHTPNLVQEELEGATLTFHVQTHTRTHARTHTYTQGKHKAEHIQINVMVSMSVPLNTASLGSTARANFALLFHLSGRQCSTVYNT